MKLYRVEGRIKCGHRLFKLEKYIVARSMEEAIAIYKASRPDAKLIHAEYRMQVHARNYECILRDDILTQIKNDA